MRSGWVACALVIAACFSPHPQAGAPCANGDCPAGLVCSPATNTCETTAGGGREDAAITTDSALVDTTGDGASLDLDGDGVPNLADNCPAVANANQFNEDGDKFGDACDPCPPVADDNPLDTDGDAVADACDPRPTIAGDTIVLFEGFHGGIPTGWFKTGTWTAGSDSISTDATAGRASLAVAGPTTTHDTVSAGLTIGTASTTADASLGVLDSYDHTSAPPKGLFCHLSKWGANTGLAIVPFHIAPEADLPYEMTDGASYTVSQRREGADYTCRAARGSVDQTVTLTNAFAPLAPEVGVRVHHMSATVEWLMVVSN